MPHPRGTSSVTTLRLPLCADDVLTPLLNDAMGRRLVKLLPPHSEAVMLVIGSNLRETPKGHIGSMRRELTEDPAATADSDLAGSTEALKLKGPIVLRRRLVVCSKRVGPREPSGAVELDLRLVTVGLLMTVLTFLVLGVGLLVVAMGVGPPPHATHYFLNTRISHSLGDAPELMAPMSTLVATACHLTEPRADLHAGALDPLRLDPTGCICRTSGSAMAVSLFATFGRIAGTALLQLDTFSSTDMGSAAQLEGGLEIQCSRLGR